MKRLFGGILLAIGILIMSGSGLCSLVVIFGGISGTPNWGITWLALLIGGIPFGLGFALFYLGRSLLRRPKKLDEDELNDRFS